ncbi:MAG: hypothetical protein RLZZ381_2532 [Cyanobacteriota bacterium]|jgi:hypothetical protein
MQSTRDCDLKDCLLIQPKRTHLIPNKATQELASELLSLLNNDSAKAMAIIKQIMYYNPNKSVEWYCEQAVIQLNRQLQSAVR